MKSVVVVGQLTMTKAYVGLNPILSIVFFYLFLLAILTATARLWGIVSGGLQLALQ